MQPERDHGHDEQDLPLDGVLATILGDVRPLSPVRRELADALGAVLAESVRASIALPPSAVSAMDGFAVRSADLGAAPTTLQVAGVVPAGRPAGRRLGGGEAMRILTGGVLPDGADAVVRVERTCPAPGDRVEVQVAVCAGEDVRPRGDVFAEGDLLLDAGRVLGPAGLALLASGGVASVPVHPRPTVGVLSTGDELVPPGQP
ncbi:hypothetical protein B7486_73315, partial [cyanobacterium TDX16]